MTEGMKPKVPLADCESCPLADRPFVPSHGPDKAKLVIVGEAPGREEVQHQEPFVGKSGKLLNMVLEHHGIDRSDVFVTNACLCRPPIVKGKQTPPNSKAMKACKERLIAEIAAREPERVITAGAVPTKSLLDTKTGIKDMRIGGAKESPHGDYEVIPTFHPAAALRSPDVFPSIVSDIKKALRVSVQWEPPKYKVVDDVAKAIRMLHKQAESTPRLALDAEWDHHSETHSRFTPDWLCIGVSHRPGAAVVYTERVCKDKRFQQEGLRKPLADRTKTWVYQNGKSADVANLWSFAPEARVGEDTMLAHYALNEIKGTHDLEQLMAEYRGAPSYKQEMRKYLPSKGASLRLLPLDVLHRYNAIDVSGTHELIDPFHEEMKRDGVFEMYQDILIPSAYSFGLMEHRGVLLDVHYLRDTIGREIAEKKVAAKAKIFEVVAELDWVTDKFCNSPMQIGKAFFELYGKVLESTDKDHLAPLVAKGNPLARALSEYRKVDKLLGTYVEGPLRDMDENHRLHVEFKLHGTETGRTSSSPNVQNWPIPEPDNPDAYNMRDAIVAPEGYKYFSCDYSGIEMVVMAFLSQDPKMCEAFRTGEGTHKPLARSLFGNNYKKREYRDTKSVAFGTLYDETTGHLAYRLGISKREAIAIQRGFHKLYSKVKGAQETFRQGASDEGELQSIFGRKRRFWLITGDNKKHVMKEALNFPIQSAAHDLTLTSLNRLTKHFDIQPNKPSPVNFTIEMHDSLSAEVRDDFIDEAAHAFKEIMEDTIISRADNGVPTRVEASVGQRWGSEEEYEFAQT